MATITRTISIEQLAQLTFGRANVAASLESSPLAECSPAANAGHALPFAGYLVGISWTLSAALTAGVASLALTVNGAAEPGSSLTLPADSATVSGFQRFERGTIPFAAGDVLGVAVTTDSEHLPTTTDLGVTLWAMQRLEGI